MGADGNLAPHRTCQQWRHTGVIHRQRIRILTSASPAKPRRCNNDCTRWGTVVVKRSTSSFADPTHALIGRVPVGDAPVGVAVLDDGSRIAVINSNRFGNSNAALSLTIIDAQKITSGEAAVLGIVSAGVFPRELRVTEDQRTLLLTNFGSKTLAVIDVARLLLEPRGK